LQHGIPTVSTQTYHTDRMLLAENEKAFLLTDPEDPDGLAAALRRLSESKNLRAELAARAEPFYRENFSYPQITTRMLDEFRRVAGPKPGESVVIRTAADGKAAVR
jgi:glycosyltransferase involved in cell wall biosynthesis